MKYTPEQIEAARRRLASYRRGMKNREVANDIFAVLAAIEAAEKERDEARAEYDRLYTQTNDQERCNAEKLEEVGDAIPEKLSAFKSLRKAWDAARKEKPLDESQQRMGR